jgi:hypothetical protein
VIAGHDERGLAIATGYVEWRRLVLFEDWARNVVDQGRRLGQSQQTAKAGGALPATGAIP